MPTEPMTPEDNEADICDWCGQELDHSEAECADGTRLSLTMARERICMLLKDITALTAERDRLLAALRLEPEWLQINHVSTYESVRLFHARQIKHAGLEK